MTNPLQLTLEFSRKERVQERFLPLPMAALEYRLRLGEGEYRDSSLPWGPELHAMLEALQHENPGPELVNRLGDLLRDFLGEAWNRHEEDIQQALEEGREAHITFLSSAEELYALPWELLRFTKGRKHLAAHRGCILRYVWRDAREARPSVDGGRILFTWSTAGGGYVPVEGHLTALEAACRRGEVPFDRARDVISDVSLARLEDELKHSQRPVTVLHVLCHGVRLEGGGYGLLWGNSSEEWAPEPVTGDRLADVLEPHASTLQLVVLCACQSAHPEVPGAHLGSVAQALHQRGIPAVVASRFPLSLPASVVLTEVLYRELLQRPTSLQRALAAVRWRLRRRFPSLDWAALQLFASRQLGTDFRPIPLRPYRGLLAFEEQQRRFFCGRGSLSRQLRRRVRQAAAGDAPRFQVVAGASGSGKSSLVMAGLLPALTNGGWESLKVRPGDPRIFTDVEQLLRRRFSPDQRVLLLVDQFEEFFTRIEEDRRGELLRALWALGRRADACIVVVITVRVDFFERAGELSVEDGLRLDRIFYDESHRLFVPQLTGTEYEDIITGPARRVGLEFDKGLVEALLKDVGEGLGALPLMEDALDQLWQRREGNQLTHDAYKAMGHVTGALTRRVERLYDTLSEDEQRQARRLLLELVDIRNDSSPLIRRRMKLADLLPAEGTSRESFTSVVEKLFAERFLAQSEAGIEMVHEALIKHWPRLGEWVQEDRERLLQIRDLGNMAEAWRVGRGALLTGDSLGYALEMQKKFGSDLGSKINRFIEQSHASFEEQRRLLEAQQVREKEQVERLRNYFRLTEAERLGENDPTLALLILREIKTDLGTAWTQPVLDMLQKPVSKAILTGHQSPIMAAFSPDGSSILTTSYDGIARLWTPDGSYFFPSWQNDSTICAAAFNPSGSHVLIASSNGTVCIRPVDNSDSVVVFREHQNPISIATFSPDGSHVLTASSDGVTYVWPVKYSGKGIVVDRVPNTIASACFSPDGSHVLSAFRDGLAGLWRADGSEPFIPLPVPSPPIVAAAYSPDGSRILIASTDRKVRIWSIRMTSTSQTVRNWSYDYYDPVIWSYDYYDLVILEGHQGALVTAAFSPDGSRVLTASSDRSARIWSVDGKTAPIVLKGHQGSLTTATFSPDGTRVLTASEDGTARLWSADGSGSPVIFQGHQGPIVSASFNRDGSRVLTASSDGTVRVWHTAGSQFPILLKGHEGSLTGASFSSDGSRVLTASADGTARVWPAKKSGTPFVLRGLRGLVVASVFSADGLRVLTAYADGTAHLWPLGAAGARITLKGHQGPIHAVAFSPDGSQVLTAGADGTAYIWSEDRIKLPLRLKGHTAPIYAAAFSPDGSCILTASGDGTACVWRVDKPERIAILRAEHSLRAAAFSPDGSRVVIASEGGTASIWKADGSGVPIVLQDHQGSILAATFSPDGQQILTASEDRTARIRNADGSGAPTILRGHQRSIHAAVYSPDGSRVLTASSDRTARVWPVDGSGSPVVLRGHQRPILAAAFSPDGSRVLTASADGTARIWPLHFQLLHDCLRAVTTACLTPEQRQLYLLESPEEATQGWMEDSCRSAIKPPEGPFDFAPSSSALAGAASSAVTLSAADAMDIDVDALVEALPSEILERILDRILDETT